jgi:hypothetical protein
MLTLDRLTALPRAGTALLVIHRWLHLQADHDYINAFDLLATVGRTPELEPEAGDLLDFIADRHDAVPTMLTMLHGLLKLELAEGLANSLGGTTRIPEDKLREFMAAVRHARGEGGAA